MDIKKLKKITDIMIANFVNKLGLDGKSYVSSNNCPIVFGDLGVFKKTLAGRFYTAKSKDLETFLELNNYSKEDQEKYLSEGMVVINDYFENNPLSKLSLITCIHERFHANRMILTNMPYSGNEDIPNFFYTEGRFIRNNDEEIDTYIDPAQEILLSSIDQSEDVINHYKDLSFEEKDDLQFANDMFGDKMSFQQAIDEALIDLMARITFEINTDKFSDIMEVAGYLSKHSKNGSYTGMSNIILRHNDLELFKWMIDPISYQNDDIHYDFFSNYITTDDLNDIKIVLESEGVHVEDEFLGDLIKKIDNKSK
ncbi:MAG: hypothetical protein IJI58_00145 [Bacilli bacterium]|nr:hypothetical protein [Bacilli bacterium]